MAIILDADVVIRGEKGAFDLKSWVMSRPSDRFEIAASRLPSYGTEWNERPGHIKWRGRLPDAVLESLPIILHRADCVRACTYLGRMEVSGKMIGFYDLIVGATALERGSEVATFNKRHFGQIKGLCVIEPK